MSSPDSKNLPIIKEDINTVFRVNRSPEPGEIIWENIGVSITEIFCKKVTTSLVTGLMFIGMLVVVILLKRFQI